MVSKNKLESFQGGYNLFLGDPFPGEEDLGLAVVPTNPCYHHIDAAYDCSMYCSPWGREESDTTEGLHFHFSFHALEKEMATHSSVLAWRVGHD